MVETVMMSFFLASIYFLCEALLDLAKIVKDNLKEILAFIFAAFLYWWYK